MPIEAERYSLNSCMAEAGVQGDGLGYSDGGIIDLNVGFKATSLLGTAQHWRAERRRAEDAGRGTTTG